MYVCMYVILHSRTAARARRPKEMERQVQSLLLLLLLLLLLGDGVVDSYSELAVESVNTCKLVNLDYVHLIVNTC